MLACMPLEPPVEPSEPPEPPDGPVPASFLQDESDSSPGDSDAFPAAERAALLERLVAGYPLDQRLDAGQVLKRLPTARLRALLESVQAGVPLHLVAVGVNFGSASGGVVGPGLALTRRY